MVTLRRLTLTFVAIATASGCASSRAGVPAGVVVASRYDARAADSVVRAEAAVRAAAAADAAARTAGSQIGPNDLLEVTVLEAPELNRTVRVAETGMISLPLLEEVRAAGRTPRELEVALEDGLRKSYIVSPHVSVHVAEMEGHGVSVVGAVARPGVFQLRDPRSLLEVIALAGGLTRDAGESVIVMRGGAARPGTAGGTADTASGVEIGLRELLQSDDARRNIAIYPGDVVKVKQAGMVYVVGEVRRPGAFPLETRSGLTVLQAIAMGEGLAPQAAKRRTVIIRTGSAGQRTEIPVDLGAVVSGKAPDPPLMPMDVVFVPNSAAKAATRSVVDALVRMVTLRAVF